MVVASPRLLIMCLTLCPLMCASAEGKPRTLSANDTSNSSGLASVYDQSSGVNTASGERLRGDAMTAAHRTLPFGTVVRVTNHQNGRDAVVRINDRGPFVRGRIIDLSPAAGRAIGMSGVAEVSLEVVSAAKKRQ
jgi:rare lipoprotein A